MQEADPTYGDDLHVPGAKADAHKPKPSLVLRDMSDAIQAVIDVATFGAAKYSERGWLAVPDAFNRYDDAHQRHMLKRFSGEEFDCDSGRLHLAHECWAALAKLQLYINSTKEYKHDLLK